jgi:hypothetical protein
VCHYTFFFFSIRIVRITRLTKLTKMTPPWIWGPVYWRFLYVVLETCSDEQAKSDLVPLVRAFHSMLPCESCRKNFKKVLEKYPPEKYLAGAAVHARLAWYNLVREEVRAHEPPKTLLYKLRKHKYEIMRAVGFIVFLLLAAIIGALVLRRCQEKGVVSAP